MRESKIETYLRKQVEGAGGMILKFKSPGHVGVPDRIVIWRTTQRPRVHFVETKATSKTPRSSQEREHARLRSYDVPVFVIDSLAMVDAYVALANMWALTGAK